MPNEFDIDQFLKEQQVPTEEKEVRPVQEVPNEPILPTEDFETPPEEVADENTPGLLDDAKELQIPIDPRKEAANYATMIDMTQRLMFTGLNKGKGQKKIGGRQQWNEAVLKLDDVEANVINEKDLTPVQRKNVKIVQRTLQKIHRLKLKDEEKELFIDALEGFVSENNYKMPPSVLLVIALISMLAPRVSDLMID